MKIMIAQRRPLWILALGLAVMALSVLSPRVAEASELLRVRHSTNSGRTRVVLDCSAPTHYRIRRVGSPERIVLDLNLPSSRRRQPLSVAGDRVRRVRINDLGSRVQVVLDLPARLPFRDFTLAASATRPFRIVVDVLDGNPSPPSAVATGAAVGVSPPAKTKRSSTSTKASGSSTSTKAEAKGSSVPARADGETNSLRGSRPQGLGSKTIHAPGEGKPYVIIIDPGHGGRDPGTRGCRVIREKDLVLGIARAMAQELRERTNFKVVLTRRDDRYVDLRRRVEIAKKHGGDLFVSIHANSARSHTAKGVEIYFLSPRGATDQAAAELADRENAAHMVGMASAADTDEVMMSILMDLQSAGILRRSGQFAELMLGELSGMQKMQARFIKQARFAVLRTLSMPSILVEVGYLSNRSEAKYLKKASTQRKMGRAMAEAVMAYCDHYGEKGRPVIARQRKHRVRKGDTLWDLARLYDTSVNAISRANHLDGNRIRVGQELILP